MDKTFPQLLVLFETGQLTGSGLDQFFRLLEEEENQVLLAAAIDDKAMDKSRLLPAENDLVTERAVALLKHAMQRLPKETNEREAPVRSIRWWRYGGWAAAALLFIIAGWYMIARYQKRLAPDIQAIARQEVSAPQVNRAMITLDDGRRIYLDSSNDGLLCNQGSVQLVKTGDGQLSYNQQGAATGKLVYNTLYNPRGSRIINMELTDGTKVWLNAGSSLSYPVSFIGNQRKVSITGEAYFEVAHNAQKPFYVTNKGIAVKVLGTHFNVNTYDDEPASVITLLEGKVAVEQTAAGNYRDANPHPAILTPGEQVIVTAASRFTIAGADIEQVMAWKNGRFVFGDKVDAATIMRQVARWYDLEVKLQGNFTKHFGGSISREANASEVFKVLEAAGGLRCKITGRKVLVTQDNM